MYRFFTHPTGPNTAHLDPPGVNYTQLYPIIPKYSPILPNYAQLQPNYTQLQPITPSHTTSTTQVFLRGAYQGVTCFACSYGGVQPLSGSNGILN